MTSFCNIIMDILCFNRFNENESMYFKLDLCMFIAFKRRFMIKNIYVCNKMFFLN